MNNTTYNGHKDWAYWNVALWMSNDEGLYKLTIDELHRSRTLEEAAETILHCVPRATPDGAEYTFENILAAIDDLDYMLNRGRGPLGRATMDR